MRRTRPEEARRQRIRRQADKLVSQSYTGCKRAVMASFAWRDIYIPAITVYGILAILAGDTGGMEQHII